MLNQVHETVRTRRWVLPVAALVGLVLLGLAYSSYQDRQRRDAALGAMVVAFKEQNSLNVFQAQVPVFVTSRKDGWIIDVEQFGVIPASVQYQLDLSRLAKENFRWDREKQTMTVTIPEPVVSEPVLDMTRAKLVNKGIIVTGGVALELMKKNVGIARREAIKEARNPQMMKLARDAARKAINHNISVPLQAAGYADTEVTVRFADEPSADPSYIDQSISYNEAIEEARKRRAAEGTR